MIEDLAQKNYSVVEDWLPKPLWLALSEDLARLWQEERFQPAKIGKDTQLQRNSKVRGDYIHWLSESPESEAQSVLVDSLNALRAELNREFFLGLRRHEAHFAVYPEGAGYDRHLDRHQGSRERAVSFVLYLNRDWHPQDGGELCVFRNGENDEIELEVAPLGGRMVIFRSDLVWHRVNASSRQRHSLTGWFRRDDVAQVGVSL